MTSHQRFCSPGGRAGARSFFRTPRCPGALSAHLSAAAGDESAVQPDPLALIRGSLTGPSPVDRGKNGSKIHILSDADGIPLITAVTSANTHDNVMLGPIVAGIPAVRPHRGPRRRKPGRLRTDKGYDYPVHRRWLRARGIFRGSPAAVSTAASAWAGIGGRSSAPWHG